jgi:hypothetical protein
MQENGYYPKSHNALLQVSNLFSKRKFTVHSRNPAIIFKMEKEAAECGDQGCAQMFGGFEVETGDDKRADKNIQS